MGARFGIATAMPSLVRFLKPGSPERLITALIGPAMAAAAMLVSLVITFALPLGDFPEIVLACRNTGLTGQVCQGTAIAAGLASIVGFGALVVSLPFLSRLTSRVDDIRIHPLLANLAVVAGIALIASHLAAIHNAPAYASRTAEIDRFSIYISAENLLWPLLVQLLLLERSPRLRAAIRAVLLAVVLLSPYRSVALAVIVFAFVLPVVTAFANPRTEAAGAWAPMRRAPDLAALVLVTAVVFVHGSIDSEQRALSASQIAAPAPTSLPPTPGAPQIGSPRKLGTVERLEQRLAYPLYQGAIAGHLAGTLPLPSIADEFARKFRFSDRPNLNEFVYRQIYPNQPAHAGETTSLYYGEGAAYFASPVMWALFGPLLLAGVWILLSRAGIDATAILAIQTWRSSFSGLVTILPALALQLLTISALFLVSRMLFRIDKRARSITQMSAWFLTAAVFALLALQGYMTVAEFERGSIAFVEFAPSAGCRFVPGQEVKAQRDADRLLGDRGLNVRSLVSVSTPDRMAFVLPHAGQVADMTETLAGELAAYTQCEAGTTPRAIFTSARSIRSFGLLALGFAVVGYLLVSGCLLLQSLWRRAEP